jgi:hypothetical protein
MAWLAKIPKILKQRLAQGFEQFLESCLEMSVGIYSS